MNNKQLTTKNINYSWVPEVAKSRFETKMDWWYFDLAERGDNIPFIRDGMFFNNETTRTILLDLYKDVFEYRYANVVNKPNFKFDSERFPVDLNVNHEDLLEKSRRYFDYNESKIELHFFEDMKRYLMHNKMFFQESYSFDNRFNKPTFRNVPFVEVW